MSSLMVASSESVTAESRGRLVNWLEPSYYSVGYRASCKYSIA